MPNHNPAKPLAPAIQKTWSELQSQAQRGIISSRQMSRQQRERLLHAGCLDPIMRGWYHLKPTTGSPNIPPNLLDFLPVYLEDRLGSHWCFSAESSLVLHLAPENLPRRLVVMAQNSSTTVHTFPNGLRLTIYQDDQHLPTRLENRAGLRIMPLETALGRLTNTQWDRQSNLVDQALKQSLSWEQVVWQWITEERYQSARRLGLGFKKLGMSQQAAGVSENLLAAGLLLPAPSPSPVFPKPKLQPDSLPELWKVWSEALQNQRPYAPKPAGTLLQQLSKIEFAIPEDAFRHLALSGYSVPPSSIMAILAGNELAADAHQWPDLDPDERLSQRGQETPLPGAVDPQALVALQGYLEAVRLAKRSIVRMMEGVDLEKVLRQDIRSWRLALMGPSAEAGLITRRQVLRYQSSSPAGQSEQQIRQLMEQWLQLVAECRVPHHRPLLAFLGLMQIRPWSIGNLRLGLLLYNVLNAAASFPWTAVDPAQKTAFGQALQVALTDGNPLVLHDLLNRYRIT